MPRRLTSTWPDVGFSNSTARLPMSTESQQREKLRKIEALFAGGGTAGERLAAEAALERVRARLAELGLQDPSIEMQFSMPGPLDLRSEGRHCCHDQSRGPTGSKCQNRGSRTRVVAWTLQLRRYIIF